MDRVVHRSRQILEERRQRQCDEERGQGGRRGDDHRKVGMVALVRQPALVRLLAETLDYEADWIPDEDEEEAGQDELKESIHSVEVRGADPPSDRRVALQASLAAAERSAREEPLWRQHPEVPHSGALGAAFEARRLHTLRVKDERLVERVVDGAPGGGNNDEEHANLEGMTRDDNG